MGVSKEGLNPYRKHWEPLLAVNIGQRARGEGQNSMTKISSTVTERKRVSFREIISYWLPPVAYMALIFYMSSKFMPAGLLPEVWDIDKVMHFVEYGILGFLWFRAIKTNVWLKNNSLPFTCFL